MASAVQFWGLGSGLSNTSEIIDAMLVYDNQKITTYQTKLSSANNKKTAWGNIQSSIESIDSIIKELSGVGKQDFKVGKAGSDGYFTTNVTSNAVEMDYSVNVKELASKHVVGSNKIDDIHSPLNMNGSFVVNGATIEIIESDTLSSIKEKINSLNNSNGSGVVASSYIIDGVLIIESGETGKDNSLNLEDTNGILQSLGIIKDDGSVNTRKEAKNALVELNGILVERPTNDISDAIEGVTITLKKVTSEDVSLNVGNDKDAIKEVITKFVNAYNDLLTKMSSYTSYDKTTGASGILNGDFTVSSVKTTISDVMQSKFVGGDFSYLFDIGISVDKSGKYVIDEKLLNSALDKNSNGVLSMLTKGLENPTSEANSTNGLFVSMKKSINSLIGGKDNIFTSKSQSFDAQVKNYNDLIERTNSYITKRKASLEAQFAALEKTMSSINNTSNYLTQLSTKSKDD